MDNKERKIEVEGVAGTSRENTRKQEHGPTQPASFQSPLAHIKHPCLPWLVPRMPPDFPPSPAQPWVVLLFSCLLAATIPSQCLAHSSTSNHAMRQLTYLFTPFPHLSQGCASQAGPDNAQFLAQLISDTDSHWRGGLRAV